MNIKAIETEYKGYRFRSRLEARWAVFFDALGLKWEYELEGFELPPDHFDKAAFIKRHMQEARAAGAAYLLDPLAQKFVDLSQRTLFYLPDFWLPDGGVWAEVKGQNQLTLEDIVKIMRLTYHTKRPCVYCSVLQGDIPGMESAGQPDRVHNLTFTFGKTDAELQEAFAVARSARFEHGEKPRIPAR